jgi:MFS transporter, DHA1 family, multidrug resistance protein
MMAVAFCIPESHKAALKTSTPADRQKRESLWKVTFSNRQFVIYTLVGAMAYSALMIYISSAPFIFIQKSGLCETQFSFAFGFNSLTLILASYITHSLSKYLKPPILVMWAAITLTVCCLGFGVVVLTGATPLGMIIFLFLSLIQIGILFPVTTALSLETVTEGKGTAAAFMGSIQLLLSFLLSTLTGVLQQGSVVPMTGLRLLVGVAAVVFAYAGLRGRKNVPLAVAMVSYDTNGNENVE